MGKLEKIPSIPGVLICKGSRMPHLPSHPHDALPSTSNFPICPSKIAILTNDRNSARDGKLHPSWDDCSHLGGGGAGAGGAFPAGPCGRQFLCISPIKSIDNEVRMAESS